MDKLIKKYSYKEYEELNWCIKEEIMYQRDMNLSVEYAQEYYEKYINYENTEIAKGINKGRAAITEKYCDCVLDIGIGSGEFIKNSNIKTYGFDINEIAVDWLKEKNIFVNPYDQIPEEIKGLCFWDSLEHIPEPSTLLQILKKDIYLFVSIPIFYNLNKVKESKHYRPNEHYYYFTSFGLINYMNDMNFKILEIQDFEIQSGREDIKTFVFKKH
jgi:hypothetical protein